MLVDDLQGVVACCDSVITEHAGEELNVLGLVLRNLLKATVCPRRESGVVEVFNGEVGKSLAVEGALEMLERQSELEDLRDIWHATRCRSCSRHLNVCGKRRRHVGEGDHFRRRRLGRRLAL